MRVRLNAELDGTDHEETKMKGWRKQKPAEPGAYYVRGFDLGRPNTHALVEVVNHKGELRCNLHESNSEPVSSKFADWSYMDTGMSDDFEWAGPLVPPNTQVERPR